MTIRSSRRRTGFTLIEIAVALMIIGVLAAAIVPRLPDAGAWRLKSTARRLAASIAYLYDTAATTQLVYRLTLDMKDRLYYVSLLNSDNEFEHTTLTFAKEASLPINVEFTGALTASQGEVDSGKAVVHFYPSGFADFAVIYIADKNKNELTLVVHPLTGKVKILEGHHEFETKKAAAKALTAGA